MQIKCLLLCSITLAVHGSKRGNIVTNAQSDLFPVSIIHMNDFHARYEETNERSTPCKPANGDKCIGGYARAITVIKELLVARKDTNPLYLNAGDNFQGTLWYNLFRWNATSHFLNMLNADAMTLGNHEFDDGVEGCVPFLETIRSPIVVANIDDSEEPTMHGKYNKSIVIDKYARKIGIIGVIVSTTNELAHTGKLKFKDEIESVKSEANVLKNQGVDIIIVLSHCGLEVDYKIARNAGPDIDVIVGGHSHTFMFTGDNPPGPDRAVDDYPAVVQQDSGHKVLIVQASAYTKYIGDLTVYFDAEGRVSFWEGNPIYLDSHIKQDEDVLREMQPWKELVDKEGVRVLGTSRVLLSRTDCSVECNIGNFLTDASVYYYIDKAREGEWTRASIALNNNGGIRTSLSPGTITYADIITTIPFENTLDLIELRGDHLLATLESDRFSSSGIKIVYNISQPVGQRVVSVDLLCNECSVPKYYPLDRAKMYPIIVNSYMAGGGNGLTIISEQKRNHIIGPLDTDVVIKYVVRQSPIMIGIEGRTTILQ
ncbi:hypothetical protein HA402_006984 [Bradysia odoriphaga]|nr:hypothetical protein HA402_006984 [Bradysia odoriphaga]